MRTALKKTTSRATEDSEAAIYARGLADGVDPFCLKVSSEIGDGVDACGKPMWRRSVTFCFKRAGVGVGVNDVFAFEKIFRNLTTTLSMRGETAQCCQAKTERQLSHKRDSPAINFDGFVQL